MREVSGYLELSALNSEVAESYLKDAETELSIAVEKLEHCLKLMKQLREYEPLFYNRQYVNKRESFRVTYKAALRAVRNHLQT